MIMIASNGNRNEDNLHVPPSEFPRTKIQSAPCARSSFAEVLAGGKLPDETSPGVIIRPSISFKEGTAIQANPFALCI
jgi:hypothetical protein